jgi:hypothetical protein
MSVWPGCEPSRSSLSGSEGVLVSISVHVEPRHLEALLDALAQVDFPINPQLFHHASVEYRYANGQVEKQPVTVVEFPAYQSRVEEVRRMLASYGFPPDCLHVADMLSEIQTGDAPEPAPEGAPYLTRALHRTAAH